MAQGLRIVQLHRWWPSRFRSQRCHSTYPIRYESRRCCVPLFQCVHTFLRDNPRLVPDPVFSGQISCFRFHEGNSKDIPTGHFARAIVAFRCSNESPSPGAITAKKFYPLGLDAPIRPPINVSEQLRIRNYRGCPLWKPYAQPKI